MDDNPYQSPHSEPARPDADRRRDFWQVLLYGPSNPLFRLAPFVFLILAAAAAYFIAWFTRG
jgi:hypothetical protein